MKLLLRGALLAWTLWSMPAAAMDTTTMIETIDVWMTAQRKEFATRAASDYPYIRAWATIAAWTKVTLEETLTQARAGKAPPTAVYPDVKEYEGWRLLEDMPEDMQRVLIKLATARHVP